MASSVGLKRKVQENARWKGDGRRGRRERVEDETNQPVGFQFSKKRGLDVRPSLWVCHFVHQPQIQ
jgi:hypothetical protein